MNAMGMLFAFGAGLMLLYMLALLLAVPIQWMLHLLINSLIGFFMLTALNFIARPLFSFSIPLNIVNLLIAGVFGVPGVILLIVIRLFL